MTEVAGAEVENKLLNLLFLNIKQEEEAEEEEVGGREEEEREEDLKQDLIIREAFEKGKDLKDYATEIESELIRIENEHVTDYLLSGGGLVELFDEIKKCDVILEQMEFMLSGFQLDLGKLSSEIQSLQDLSLSMSIKLKNRLVLLHALFIAYFLFYRYLSNSVQY
jgi:vacuolar protein sorting-associated protein 52